MNEFLSSINGLEFLDWLSDCQLVTKNFDAFKRTGRTGVSLYNMFRRSASHIHTHARSPTNSSNPHPPVQNSSQWLEDCADVQSSEVPVMTVPFVCFGTRSLNVATWACRLQLWECPLLSGNVKLRNCFLVSHAETLMQTPFVGTVKFCNKRPCVIIGHFQKPRVEGLTCDTVCLRSPASYKN